MTSGDSAESQVADKATGWPPAELGSLTTIRLIILPEPGEGGDGDPRAWQLMADKHRDDTLQITGEMIRIHSGGFLTVASTAVLRFAPGHAPPLTTSDERDAALNYYGPWASHALWDYCRVVLLQASAGFPLHPALEIPVLTPTPVCVTEAMRSEDDEEKPVDG